jgi:hypothetical protein
MFLQYTGSESVFWSRLTCTGDLHWLTCTGCPVLAILSYCPVLAVLPRLTYLSCLVPAFLSMLPCSGRHVHSGLSKPTCPLWLVQANLCPGWPVSRLTCPGWPVQADLSRLTCLADLYRLTCTGSPVPWMSFRIVNIETEINIELLRYKFGISNSYGSLEYTRS